MSTTETVKSLQEYVSIPIVKLIESSTNPRKAFDEERLEELAESIRSKGILSPLVVRPVNGHFEIVAGARRYRAAQRAGLKEIPVRVGAFTDAEALEIQIIENIQRADVHPFEEAQGFRALLDREGAEYTIEKIAAKTGKAASFIAKRLKLLDLTQPAADALVAGHIGVEHALLIAKLAPEIQEKALAHCFDGYFAANDAERSLVPASRLQAWIEQNVYLSLKSVPFSKDDETLLPEAGSCANCPKRTGFNTLLFSEVRQDSCSDAECFNRKLDRHIVQRMEKHAKPRDDFGEVQHPGRDADSAAPELRRSHYPESETGEGRPARTACMQPLDPCDLCGRVRQRPTREGLRRPNVQNPFPRATEGGKTAAAVEGGENGYKPEAQADDFLPPPAYGRCSQTCEATIWNRRNANGGWLCVALPVTRTGVPPCQAAWVTKPEGPPRLSDGREGPDALQEGRRRWTGETHLRSNPRWLRREDE